MTGAAGASGMTGAGGGVVSAGAVLVVGSAEVVVVTSEDVVDSAVVVVDLALAVTVCVTHLMATAVFQITLRSSRTGAATAMSAPETARRTDDLILKAKSCDVGDFLEGVSRAFKRVVAVQPSNGQR